MKKKQIQNVIVHIVKSDSLTNKINEFHSHIIERKLASSCLTTEEKIVVIDKIIENLDHIK